MSRAPLLAVEGLRVAFRTRAGEATVVRDLSIADEAADRYVAVPIAPRIISVIPVQHDVPGPGRDLERSVGNPEVGEGHTGDRFVAQRQRRANGGRFGQHGEGVEPPAGAAAEAESAGLRQVRF